MGKTPSMATCERCHVKFFTPLELIPHPVKARENLQQAHLQAPPQLTHLAGPAKPAYCTAAPLPHERRQTLRDLHSAVNRLTQRQRPSTETLAQGIAFQQLRHQIRHALIR